MRRLLLVANPSASGFAASTHREVVEILSKGFEVDAVWPAGPDEARERASRAAGEADVVAAMGGDGVVHQVANGIAGSETALAVVAVGTTNVVARLLGMPRGARDAAEAIAAAGGARAVPTLSVRADDRREIHAVFAAGVGFDADVIAESERRPHRKLGVGTLHYGLSALSVARAYRGRLPTLRVTGDGGSADGVGVQVQVHDDLTYLGPVPLRLGPGPGPVAAVIERASITRLARVVMRAVMRRDLAPVKGMEVWRSFSEVAVEADPPAAFQADGELLGEVSSVTFAPAHSPLMVLDVPARSPRV